MMSATPPLVTVITPAYNAEKTLGAAIASVQAQYFTDWELWVIDDGSHDRTLKVAEERAAKDPRVNIIALSRNRGPAAARNTGIAAARGRYFAFLDADDIWYPHKLLRQMNALRKGAVFVHSAYRRIGPDGQLLGVVTPPRATNYRDAVRRNPIGCLTAIYDSAFFGRIFMPDLPLRQDYAHWLNLLRGGAAAEGLQDVLADYRLRRDSISANKLRAARGTWQVLRKNEQLPLTQAVPAFSNYAVEALRLRMN